HGTDVASMATNNARAVWAGVLRARIRVRRSNDRRVPGALANGCAGTVDVAALVRRGGGGGHRGSGAE
ncbi:MAG: hypothetical protein K0U84_08175, partial [Actinomycetia bacterium]|nr:hypothetical protein [Actinomycetes bacterium]